MSDIKIFVSNRIDKRSKQIDNPLFVPVRCGAVFDDSDINKGMLGDDTGDNISDRRMSFCELTVQYWAWKNQKADYYGLCHYRRYMSFKTHKEEKSSEERNNGCITLNDLSDENIKEFGLTEDFMRSEIEKYDAIFVEPIDLSRYKFTNYSAMEHSPDYHIMKDMDIAIQIVKEKYPEMSEVVDEYMFNYKYEYLYNCFVMKAELFGRYSAWLFDILFELEKRIDMSTYTMKQYRTPGTITERLLGIFILYLEKSHKYKIKHNSLLFIEDTDPDENLVPAFQKNSIPLVLCADDNYVIPLVVFLMSLVEHLNKSFNYDIYILNRNLSQKSKSRVDTIIKDIPNIALRYINPDRVIPDLKFYDFYLLKLFVPFILNDYKKCIVLDTDIILNGDLSNLYMEELTGNLCAAVKDLVVQGCINAAKIDPKSFKTVELGISNPYDYINTGVLLLNNDLYRKLFSVNDVKNFIKRSSKKAVFGSKDIINIFFEENKIKFLSQSWNYCVPTSEFVSTCMFLSAFTSKWEHDQLQNPSIIHFCGEVKPWFVPAIDKAALWWKYARMTPFYEEVLYNMTSYFLNKNEENKNKESKILKHYKKLVLNYWKTKLLSKISSGKTKTHYLYKANELKRDIRVAKNLVKSK